MICDCHTHRADSDNGIIAVEPREADFLPGKLYSMGIHPWSSGEVTEEELRLLDELATHPQVVAIGESGLDRLRGADLDRQTTLFRHHIRLSEKLRKPLIVHCVRCISELIGERKKSGAVQPWIFHGFRGNAVTAGQLCDAGIMLSFGEKFTPGVPRSIPPEMLLAETDTSDESIESITSRVSPDDPAIPARNLTRILSDA